MHKGKIATMAAAALIASCALLEPSRAQTAEQVVIVCTCGRKTRAGVPSRRFTREPSLKSPRSRSTGSNTIILSCTRSIASRSIFTLRPPPAARAMPLAVSRTSRFEQADWRYNSSAVDEVLKRAGSFRHRLPRKWPKTQCGQTRADDCHCESDNSIRENS